MRFPRKDHNLPPDENDLKFQPYQFDYERFGRLPSYVARLGEVEKGQTKFEVAAERAFKRGGKRFRDMLAGKVSS